MNDDTNNPQTSESNARRIIISSNITDPWKSVSDEEKRNTGFLRIGLDASKLISRGRTTGFKPYKRCSMEAKESGILNSNPIIHVEQKDPKRMRLKTQAST
ncbi:hypothetical protein ARALYDRAFT_901097 [Arabidopsis lyrata subsp. lyrata]|uniref:Uncharacterized protein n=1 Tax=Arabidopsis lyrata subsp. lyrata TaxID=81972 RepID=D7LJH6_ARALL|nr:hypothetical protein ARALYDRAFT_901097 [Arabidopsis lyrata subsp. lyrata]